MKKRPPKYAFDLTSGRLCLDFANTLDHRTSSQPQEKLTGFAELVAFGEQAKALSELEARELRDDTRENSREASAVFQRAVAVREVIFRILSAAANCRKVSPADVETFNTLVRRSHAQSLLLPGNEKAPWQRLDKGGNADRLIWRIVRSAVEILTSGDILRVKSCAAGDCDWLFIDSSRSRNRRWCEMKTCGSRHKARAYYQRKKADRQHVSGRSDSAR
jgi:predicted RNA-binding Zn ribbon-like protein